MRRGFERSFSMTDPNVALFVGYGNTPNNSVIGGVSKFLIISALVDTRTHVVLDAEANVISEISKEFIISQMLGKNLIGDANEIIEAFARYQAPAQKSLIVAFKALLNRYTNYINQQQRLSKGELTE